MSVLSIVLLVVAVALVAGAEWPRLSRALGVEAGGRQRREREQRKAQLRVIRNDDADDFVESVRRDLERLPTFDRDTDR